MLPYSWFPMTRDVPYKQVKIEPSDRDYGNAMSLFTLADNFTLVHIY